MIPNQISPGEYWHLDKKVPISIIFALLIQASMGLWAIADIKKDVELLKDARGVQRDRDVRQDVAQAEAVGLVRGDIKEVGAKLDRLLERELRKNSP